MTPVEAAPEDLKPEFAKALATPGWQVGGKDGAICRVWFAKAPDVQQSFSPTSSVKFPFKAGAFVGVLEVMEGGEFTDFRQLELAPGLYTLRYAQQPQDGNHIGTSTLFDFLLVVQANADKSPGTLNTLDELVELATEAGGASHPAFLALRPAESAKPGEARLVQDAAEDLWALETAVGSDKPLPLRLVVVGFAQE